MHEDDGDRLDAVRAGAFEVAAYRCQIGRRPHGAIGAHAFGDLDDTLEQHVGFDDVAGKDFWPCLVADLEGITESFGGDQHCAGALALKQRIGGDRGAHLDGADESRRYGLPGLEADEVADALNGGVAIGLGIFRQQLMGCERAVRPPRDHVRKSAAAVDPEFPL